MKIKIILSLSLTLIIFSSQDYPLVSIQDMSFLMLVISIIYQILIGIVFGLVIHVVFQAFVLAGQVLAMQMGLGFAQLVDPQNGISVTALGQLYMMTATLLYLSINGHLFVINALMESFQTIPVMLTDFQALQYQEIINFGGFMFVYGLKIALPAIVALLITNIAFGIMTKAAPQINIFTLGFSITMVVGIALVWITLAFLFQQFTEITQLAHLKINEIMGIQ
jgi:flagellar biosynthetic protein FliR